ncbi:Transcriptional regulatory protein DegU [Pelagimonas phthalicica]|uniref:Transcriptional regulatory protein DegU n=1 Tax=Pelagimonas phthalicica TaxID=1037362 RepID=A0A238JGR5_9RHOB|nr:response regulator transcription factor [Pelagimonas phthalicica]TDS92276.1 LuxR family two component transcriptional regulator [Pelagimonas phthalicica]SMX29337.1 Transcriptional regulatory protein DegU [Pelagimonas phthalicica]
MKILLADDHGLVRDTLVAFMETTGEFDVEAVSNFDQAFERVQKDSQFDLVLLDFKMPQMNGLEGLQRILALPSAPKVALISGNASRDVADAALEAGAAGFVPKTLAAQSLINAIRFMAMGEKYAPLEFMTAEDEKPSHPLAEKLTAREMQVLEGLTKGQSNKEIARDLDLAEPTIKLHVKTLYRKIDVHNRTQAALVAKEAGLF